METLELVLDIKATLGEGPSWDAEQQLLYWVDIPNQHIHIFNPQDGSDHILTMPSSVGAVVPRASGGLVAALKDGFYAVDMETGETQLLARSPDADDPYKGLRFNDGKCDAAGRLLAGTLSGERHVSKLYRLQNDLRVETLIEGVSISNGIAWSPDHRTMYYVDSPTKEVVAYDYDLDTGVISNKRVVIKTPEDQGVPDGMTSDAEGMLWVAQWGGYRVNRWNPYTGECLQSIEIPAAHVTSCVFGGVDLNDLYITCARDGLSEEQLQAQPQAGGLFRVRTHVQGMPTYAFQG